MSILNTLAVGGERIYLCKDTTRGRLGVTYCHLLSFSIAKTSEKLILNDRYS